MVCIQCVHVVPYLVCVVFFFKQKTAYELRISDWSSDVCSSDLTLSCLSLNACASARLCAALAWMVTSSAVVGSSAISSFGRQASAKIGRASCRERGCQYV